MAASTAATGSGEGSPGTADPFLSPDASCAEFERTAAGGTGGRRLLVDSPGQIVGDLKVRVEPDGRYHGLVHASVGSEIEVSALLHNPSYTDAEGVWVSASIAADRGRCWRILAHAHTRSLPEARPRLGPSLILLEGAGSATLEYVAGSTELFDEQGHILAKGLSDGVTKGRVYVPYSVPDGTAYYLNFRLRLKARNDRTPGAASTRSSS